MNRVKAKMVQGGVFARASGERLSTNPGFDVEMTSSRIPGLDALRGLAALLVLAYHLRGLALPSAVLSHGYLAVDLFFVISGFVLARAWDARLAGGEGARFLVRRLARLYPMMLLGLALGVGYWLMRGDAPSSLNLLVPMALAFIPFTGVTDIFPLNGPQWSLMWELLANLVYALIAPWLTSRRLIALVLTSGLAHAVLVLKLGTGSLGPFAHDWMAGGPRVLFGFFAGVLLARLDEDQRLCLPAAPMAVILATVVLMLSPPLPTSYRAVFDLVAVLAVFPLVVATAARASVVQGRALLDGLAGISYALYALHIPIVMSMARLGHGLPSGAMRWGVDALAAPLALAAAWAAHRWFEPWAARIVGYGSRFQGVSTSLPSSSTR
jgi:peptidoglycan/LPS O-acetylase OafA/YrhL